LKQDGAVSDDALKRMEPLPDYISRARRKEVGTGGWKLPYGGFSTGGGGLDVSGIWYLISR
jgi:hypothetical protein